MGWSFTIGSFKGTAIRIHITLILFLVWIGFATYLKNGSQAAIESLIFISTIFICITLHEFGHILTAKYFGIASPEVTLLPIGGAASMDRMPDKPYQELLVATAGPAVNVIIALILLLARQAFDFDAALRIEDPTVSLTQRLAAANLFLALFNLIPAFPMDGGRVLRALLAMWIGPKKATNIAATVGQCFAFLLGFAGFFGNPMLIFIAIFIYMAASSEAQMTNVMETTKDLLAAQAMETCIVTIRPEATLKEAVEGFLASSQDELPLVEAQGKLRGMLSRTDLVDALRDTQPDMPIAPFAKDPSSTIRPEEPISAVLQALSGTRPVVVIDENERFLGLLTRQSLAEIIMIRDIKPNWRFSRQSSFSRMVAKR
jgi:stage IV sporulation protein FB